MRSLDLLEDMSIVDGGAFNARLISIMRGDVLPDRKKPEPLSSSSDFMLTFAVGNIPVEYIMYDLWEEMRAKDKALADQVVESTCIFMRAQTDKSRLSIKGLGQYLDYREGDIGMA